MGIQMSKKVKKLVIGFQHVRSCKFRNSLKTKVYKIIRSTIEGGGRGMGGGGG